MLKVVHKIGRAIFYVGCVLVCAAGVIGWGTNAVDAIRDI